MKENTKKRNGDICPQCNNTNIEWGSAEVNETGIAFPLECKCCGFKGKQWNSIVFDYFVNEKGEVIS